MQDAVDALGAIVVAIGLVVAAVGFAPALISKEQGRFIPVRQSRDTVNSPQLLRWLVQ